MASVAEQPSVAAAPAASDPVFEALGLFGQQTTQQPQQQVQCQQQYFQMQSQMQQQIVHQQLQQHMQRGLPNMPFQDSETTAAATAAAFLAGAAAFQQQQQQHQEAMFMYVAASAAAAAAGAQAPQGYYPQVVPEATNLMLPDVLPAAHPVAEAYPVPAVGSWYPCATPPVAQVTESPSAVEKKPELVAPTTPPPRTFDGEDVTPQKFPNVAPPPMVLKLSDIVCKDDDDKAKAEEIDQATKALRSCLGLEDKDRKASEEKNNPGTMLLQVLKGEKVEGFDLSEKTQDTANDEEEAQSTRRRRRGGRGRGRGGNAAAAEEAHSERTPSTVASDGEKDSETSEAGRRTGQELLRQLQAGPIGGSSATPALPRSLTAKSSASPTSSTSQSPSWAAPAPRGVRRAKNGEPRRC
eukprot:TRINITY_DN15899_c0_g1_i1.p1 TRINITY_DN15899_c0_g1~~TRINITY_DN15899_c0_g1_i1.p1  ORF type:complete len:410 (-),score=131.35 TRINITY_DN15899_c0_g1_i1:321-1550(-)